MILRTIVLFIFQRSLLWQVAAAVGTYSTIKVVVFYRRRYLRLQILKQLGIPGPEPNIIDGNLSDYRQSDVAGGKDAEFKQRYGKIFGTYVGDSPSLTITDLDILKKIFLESSKSFTERSDIYLTSPVVKSILFARHNRWRAMRKAITPAFSKYSIRGNSHTDFIEESIRLMIEYIERRNSEAQQAGKEASIDIHDLMKSTTLKLITAIAIPLPGMEVREKDPFVESLDTFMSRIDKGLLTFAVSFPFFRRFIEYLANNYEFDKALALVRRTLNKKIDEGLSELAHGTNDSKSHQVIDDLIKLHFEGKISRDELMGNAEAILMAGYDTTSTTLTHLLWALGKHPQIQEKLRLELMTHGIESKYLRQVIDETMRLYPIVIKFTTRVAAETLQIGDLVIPKGTRVVYNNKLIFHDPDIWPEPEKFDPERFRDGVEHHPCAFAPFGLGDRKCLGYQLAMLEMRMIVCDILLRFRVKLVSPADLELVAYSIFLAKPRQKVILRMEQL